MLNHEVLMKSRGYGATLNDSYRMFSGNIKTIVRHLWPYALALSLIMAVYLTAIKQAIFHPSQSIGFFLGISALGTLQLAATIIFYARAMMLVDGKPMSWNILRTIKSALWIALACLIVTILVGGVTVLTGYLTAPSQPAQPPTNEAEMMIAAQQASQALLATAGVALLTFVVICLLFLPLVYTFTKYYMEPETHFLKILPLTYRRGMRHWAYLFVTTLILLIAVGLIYIVVCLPLAVLFIAMYHSAMGVAQGDPSGMPGQYGWLFFITTMLTYFILLIIDVYCIFAACYLYGSIETREKERMTIKAE